MRRIVYFTAIAALFFSCQKEVSVELGGQNPPVTGAAFTFGGAPNACTGATPAGYYAAGTALSSSNTVSIQVNVITAGTYSIQTNTVNGYQFSANGTFTATGTQTVVLSGSGTPGAAQTDNFTPAAAGITGCTFSITVVTPAPAVFTYSGAPNACTVANVNGTYAVGTVLTSSNTVTVEVNVTTPGTFSITAGPVGGMTFSKTGSFATTGVQTVTLTGSGTPSVSGSNTFTVGTNGCTFNVPVTGPAVYTFSGAPGGCTVANVAGTYVVGTALTASNTVTVEVNVTVAGSYNITTSAIGGMIFSKSGIFTNTGVQTVILNGSGTPTTGGANAFTVGTNGCTFNVPVTGPAVYTFSGAPGNCTNANISGSYTVASTLGATHTVTIQVNVSSIGGYTISTTAGGMTFSKTGVFATTGVQTVTLTGSGVPTTAGPNTFTVGTGGCTFSIPVTAALATYQCKIDGVLTSFSDRAQGDVTDDFWSPPTPYLYLNGYTGPANGGTVPQFQIFITRNDNSAITTGTYNGDAYLQPNGYRIEIDYTVENPDQTVTIWNTSSTLFPPPNPAFTIIITSITSTRIKGTFSGKLTNTLQGSTLFKNITEGTFDLPILP